MKLRISISERIALVLAAAFILVPLFMAPAPCLVTQQAKYYCKQQEWKRIVTGTHITDWLTLLILGAQLAVFGRQANISDRQNELIARQADISEQAMTIGQWPYIFVNFHRFVTPWGAPDHATAAVPIFEYSVKIHGGSPAILRRIYEILTFEETRPPLPSPIDIGWQIIDLSVMPGTSWPNFTGEPRTRHARYEGNRDALFKLGSGQRTFFIVAVFVYDDLFGNQHEMGFCYSCGREGGPGMINGGAAYNYHRKREPHERI